MNATLLYWTVNSKQDGFFLDSEIQFHRILKDGEPVKGREEARRKLAESRPHQKSIWVDTPEALHRIAVEMKMGERNLDERPLAQIAAIVQRTTPHWHPVHRQARHIAKLAEQYEQGQINQSRLLRELREHVNKLGENKDERNSQSQHFALFLCELTDIQLA